MSERPFRQFRLGRRGRAFLIWAMLAGAVASIPVTPVNAAIGDFAPTWNPMSPTEADDLTLNASIVCTAGVPNDPPQLQYEISGPVNLNGTFSSVSFAGSTATGSVTLDAGDLPTGSYAVRVVGVDAAANPGNCFPSATVATFSSVYWLSVTPAPSTTMTTTTTTTVPSTTTTTTTTPATSTTTSTTTTTTVPSTTTTSTISPTTTSSTTTTTLAQTTTTSATSTTSNTTPPPSSTTLPPSTTTSRPPTESTADPSDSLSASVDPAGFEIVGLLTTSNGRPVSGVTLVLTDESGHPMATRTDAGGRFLFHPTHAGPHRLGLVGSTEVLASFVVPSDRQLDIGAVTVSRLPLTGGRALALIGSGALSMVLGSTLVGLTPRRGRHCRRRR